MRKIILNFRGREEAQQDKRRVLKIFVPTTPNPTSGFFCYAPEDEVEKMDITVDEAFKLIISAGYANLDTA